MGRLLSSWPAHGEKRGKGEGDVALYVMFAQNSFFRTATYTLCLFWGLGVGLWVWCLGGKGLVFGVCGVGVWCLGFGELGVGGEWG